MLNAALDTKTWWWLARSSGMVAWALVTASIVWGLTLSTRLIRRRGTPAWLLDLHRYLGTLSLVFTAIHLIGLWADSFVTFGARELFIPFASEWRTRAVVWGILALYLLIAIEITSWVMRWLPRRFWHSIHLSSFVLFASVTAHGFLAGTDRSNLALQWVALTGCSLVGFLAAFRLFAPRRGERTVPRLVPDAAAGPSSVVTPIDDGSAERAARIAALAQRRSSRSV
jgi:predicted ferric reductase